MALILGRFAVLFYYAIYSAIIVTLYAHTREAIYLPRKSILPLLWAIPR